MAGGDYYDAVLTFMLMKRPDGPLGPGLREALDRVVNPPIPSDAQLGYATCADLLRELSARLEIHGPGLEYRPITPPNRG